MHRHVAAVIALAALALASAAHAAGPTYVTTGGLGVRSPDGKTRYVAVATSRDTAIARVRVADGAITAWAELDGLWGIPAPTFGPRGGEGLTRDGRRLIVGAYGSGNPSRFAVLDTRRMRIVDRFSLDGSFAYDALSPDGSTLYLIEHVDRDNVNRYVVRSYDLGSHWLAPGRIADKAQLGWVMEGTAVTRATSADGRWVYTLYQRSGGYPFVHALDTVDARAHCIGLPYHGDENRIRDLRLALGPDGRSLDVRWRAGRRWLAMDTSTWRLTHLTPAAFPWRWVVAGTAGALLAALVLAALALRLRRRGGDGRKPVPLAL